MVLACSDKPGFLDHANEAVRIAQLAIDSSTVKTQQQQDLLQSCQHVLREAQEAHDELSEEEEEEDSGDEHLEIIGVWENGKFIVTSEEDEGQKQKTAEPVEGAAESMEIDQKVPAPGGEIPKGKKIKSRRIDRYESFQDSRIVSEMLTNDTKRPRGRQRPLRALRQGYRRLGRRRYGHRSRAGGRGRGGRDAAGIRGRRVRCSADDSGLSSA